MSKDKFAGKGFRVLAGHPVLKKIQAELRGDHKVEEARQRAEKIRSKLDTAYAFQPRRFANAKPA